MAAILCAIVANKGALRKQLMLLAHENPSELVAMDLRKQARILSIGFFQGVTDVASWIDAVEREHPYANYFIGVADRRKGTTDRAKTADIDSLGCLVFDIDPVRAPNTMATPEQRQAAMQAAELLERVLQDRGYLSGSIACSGNGAYLFHPIETVRFLDTPDFDRRVANFISELRPLVSSLPVKLDHTFDWPRLIRVIGTQNRKGEDESLWQTSSWMNQ